MKKSDLLLNLNINDEFNLDKLTPDSLSAILGKKVFLLKNVVIAGDVDFANQKLNTPRYLTVGTPFAFPGIPVDDVQIHTVFGNEQALTCSFEDNGDDMNRLVYVTLVDDVTTQNLSPTYLNVDITMIPPESE